MVDPTGADSLKSLLGRTLMGEVNEVHVRRGYIGIDPKAGARILTVNLDDYAADDRAGIIGNLDVSVEMTILDDSSIVMLPTRGLVTHERTPAISASHAVEPKGASHDALDPHYLDAAIHVTVLDQDVPNIGTRPDYVPQIDTVGRGG